MAGVSIAQQMYDRVAVRRQVDLEWLLDRVMNTARVNRIISETGERLGQQPIEQVSLGTPAALEAIKTAHKGPHYLRGFGLALASVFALEMVTACGNTAPPTPMPLFQSTPTIEAKLNGPISTAAGGQPLQAFDLTIPLSLANPSPVPAKEVGYAVYQNGRQASNWSTVGDIAPRSAVFHTAVVPGYVRGTELAIQTRSRQETGWNVSSDLLVVSQTQIEDTIQRLLASQTPTPVATATPIPIATPGTPFIFPTSTPTPDPLISQMKFYVSDIRHFDEGLADLIVEEFGRNGYDSQEVKAVRGISRALPSLKFYSGDSFGEFVKDFRDIVQGRTYRFETATVSGRPLELIIIASDPSVAPKYKEMAGDVFTRVESFTGLQYPGASIVIHNPPDTAPNTVLAPNFGGEGIISSKYPNNPDGIVLRRYETTTRRNAWKEFEAHEFTHNLDALGNIPIWLREGRASFTMHHALRTQDGLPVVTGTFDGYYDNLTNGVPSLIETEFDGKFPPLATLARNTRSGLQGLFGEIFLNDMLKVIGPQNMSGFFKEIGKTAQQKSIDEATFRTTALNYTPQELQPQMTQLLQQWYHRDK